MNVIVSDAAGKAAYQGTTNSDGLFATGKLTPGDYVVQFNSHSRALKGNQYLIVVSAGTKKISADSVAGEKFSSGGVAMRVPVGSALKITGQVVSEQPITTNGEGNVRIIQGRRYFWAKNETGSNLGRWVESGSNASRNIVRMETAQIRKLQDRSGEGSMATTQRVPEGHGLYGH
jgi:hypothetical protein